MTSTIDRPIQTANEYLEGVEQILPQIREAASAIEAARQLPPEIAELLRSAGVFSVAVPRTLGGPEIDPITIAEGIERLARADGSTGWCAMIGSDVGFLTGFLGDPASSEVIGNFSRATIFVLNPSMAMARVVEGGYTVSGRWTFSSGCTHAGAYALGCLAVTDQGPRMASATVPEIRVVVMTADKAQVVDTWTTTGLRGSGSHDVVVNEVFIPEHHTFPLFPATMKRDGPLYRSPMTFVWKIGAVPLGMARGAIDDVIGMARTKISLASRSPIAGQTWLHMAISQAEMNLQAARAGYYAALQTAWDATLTDAGPTPEMKIRMYLAQVNAFEKSVNIVDSMYRAGGSAALYAGATLDRRLRDIHTMSQHALLGPETVAIAGQVLLGLEPDLPPMLQ